MKKTAKKNNNLNKTYKKKNFYLMYGGAREENPFTDTGELKSWIAAPKEGEDYVFFEALLILGLKRCLENKYPIEQVDQKIVEIMDVFNHIVNTESSDHDLVNKCHVLFQVNGAWEQGSYARRAGRIKPACWQSDLGTDISGGPIFPHVTLHKLKGEDFKFHYGCRWSEPDKVHSVEFWGTKKIGNVIFTAKNDETVLNWHEAKTPEQGLNLPMKVLLPIIYSLFGKYLSTYRQLLIKKKKINIYDLRAAQDDTYGSINRDRILKETIDKQDTEGKKVVKIKSDLSIMHIDIFKIIASDIEMNIQDAIEIMKGRLMGNITKKIQAGNLRKIYDNFCKNVPPAAGCTGGPKTLVKFGNSENLKKEAAGEPDNYYVQNKQLQISSPNPPPKQPKATQLEEEVIVPLPIPPDKERDDGKKRLKNLLETMFADVEAAKLITSPPPTASTKTANAASSSSAPAEESDKEATLSAEEATLPAEEPAAASNLSSAQKKIQKHIKTATQEYDLNPAQIKTLEEFVFSNLSNKSATLDRIMMEANIIKSSPAPAAAPAEAEAAEAAAPAPAPPAPAPAAAEAAASKSDRSSEDYWTGWSIMSRISSKLGYNRREAGRRRQYKTPKKPKNYKKSRQSRNYKKYRNSRK